MKVVLVFSFHAKEEFKEAAKWYNERRIGLGDEFFNAIMHKISLIENNPERYPVRKGHFRETLTRNFPFIIVYRYNKTKGLITISSIFHTSRNPKLKYRK